MNIIPLNPNKNYDSFKRNDAELIGFTCLPTLRDKPLAYDQPVYKAKNGNYIIPTAVCPCFNADFDGDQMDMIIPQIVPSKKKPNIVKRLFRDDDQSQDLSKKRKC